MEFYVSSSQSAKDYSYSFDSGSIELIIAVIRERRFTCLEYALNYNVFVKGVDGIYGKFQMKGSDGLYAVNRTLYKGNYLNQGAYTGASTILVKARINGASTYVSNYISY